MRVLAVTVLTIALAGRARAQLGPAEVHAHVAEFIATRAPRALPEGDTLVSWNGDRPVLFHTASRDSGGVRSGMLRADRMFGAADVRWDAQAPRSFVVQWLTPGPTSTDSTIIRGVVETAGLRISRVHAADTVLAIPEGRWAVADYGMHELLLPAFDSLASDTPTTVMVLRPYKMKWDALRVSAGAVGNGWRIVRWTDSASTHWTATIDGPHLLWVRRSDHPDDETAALEGTSTRATLDRIRVEVEPASRPRLSAD